MMLPSGASAKLNSETGEERRGGREAKRARGKKDAGCLTERKEEWPKKNMYEG